MLDQDSDRTIETEFKGFLCSFVTDALQQQLDHDCEERDDEFCTAGRFLVAAEKARELLKPRSDRRATSRVSDDVCEMPKQDVAKWLRKLVAVAEMEKLKQADIIQIAAVKMPDVELAVRILQHEEKYAVPLCINGSRIMGIYDTGCCHTLLSKEFALKHKIALVESQRCYKSAVRMSC